MRKQTALGIRCAANKHIYDDYYFMIFCDIGTMQAHQQQLFGAERSLSA